MEHIGDEDFSRILPSIRRGEEIPVEEIDAVTVPDWNAIAWEQIQARDAKALKIQSLIDILVLKPTHVLISILKVCIYEQQDEELQELIRSELKRRPEIVVPDVP